MVYYSYGKLLILIFRYVTYMMVNLSEPNHIVKDVLIATDAEMKIDFSINYN